MCIHEHEAVAAFIEAVRQNKVRPKISDEDLKFQSLDILPTKVLRKTLLAIKNKYGYHTDLRILCKIAPLVRIGSLPEVMQTRNPLTQKLVLDYFEEKACCPAGVSISGQFITRPYLIALVEQLEQCTGRRLTDHSQAPLRYIEEACEADETITIADVAEFFTQNDGKIRQILARVRAQKPTMRNEVHFSRKIVRDYVAGCFDMNAATLDENVLIKTLQSSVAPGDIYSPLHWCEERFNKILPDHFIENKTVKDLIDFFVA